MRYESPVTDGGRIALADLELPSGEHVAAGTNMGISWHAANLDPDAFDDPLTVDFDARPEPPHRLRQRLPPLPRLAPGPDGDARRRWRRGTSGSPTTRSPTGSDLTYTGNPRAPHHLTLTW